MSLDEDGDTRNSNFRSNYEHEDLSPTTPQELNGWYAYPIAAEVFAVVAVGAFIPVILEQLARQNGFFAQDRTKPCVEHHDTRIRMRDANQTLDQQCILTYMGKSMSTSSFAMYTSSVAVSVQALVLIFLSAFADYGPYRKNMLMTFTYVGSVATGLFVLVPPSAYYLAPLLVVVGITCLGCSFVLLNAFLPLLVSNTCQAGSSNFSTDETSDFELEPLNAENDGPMARKLESKSLTQELELSARISSNGVGYGYIAAVVVEVFSIFILWLFSKTRIQKSDPTIPIRVVLTMTGLWWAICATPTLLWLRPRPGPPLPSLGTGFGRSKVSGLRVFGSYVLFSLASLWRTAKCITCLRQTVLFLAAWFFLSDAVATISGTAILFARVELKMGTIAIALLSITSVASGIIGAFAWPRIQKRFLFQPKSVLICCVLGLELIPLYGLLGFLPVFRTLGFIGLQKAWEIYPVAVLHGFIMGGISSYARSIFASLIPEGSEAAFFAFYAITDKGSSAFGPALVGWIVDHAGSIRPVFLFLAVLVLIPAPLLLLLNVENGREDARRLAYGGS